MVVYKVVHIYRNLRVRLDTNTYGEYDENDFHKPVYAPGVSQNQLTQSGLWLYSYSDATPRKGYELSQLEVDTDWSVFSGLISKKETPRFIELFTTDYFRIWGWIDRIEPVATKGPSKNTRIYWHPDYWLNAQLINMSNYLSSASNPRYINFKQGRVKRGPAAVARPDPSAPRKWIFDSAQEIKTALDTKGPYVIVLRTIKTLHGNNDYHTEFEIKYWGLKDTAINGYPPIPIEKIYSGNLEEILGIDPDTIIGVWFSPVSPDEASNPAGQGNNNGTYGWYEMFAGNLNTAGGRVNLMSGSKMTTDTQKIVIVDPMGTEYATFPWGVEVEDVMVTVDVGANGAFLDIDLLEDGQSVSDVGEGRRVQIPLIPAPVTSNALSSYVYSGQQAYDRELAEIQRKQNLASGIAGMGTSAIGGAIAGSAVAPGVGTVAGLVGGAASAGIGSATQYYLQGETDRKSQAASEQLMANQAANVIVPGGSELWYTRYGGKWRIVKLVRDSDSLSEITAEQSELGYITDSYRADCSSLINAGGPLRIEGLIVNGDIPPQGRAYISAMFEKGVHLDLIQ